MKKIISFILMCALLVNITVVTYAEETIKGISINAMKTDSTVTIDSQEAYDGKSSLKITKSTPEESGNYLTITTSVSVETGAEYEYGFYAKANKAVKQSVMINWGTRHNLAPVTATYGWTGYKYNYTHNENSKSVVIRFIFDGTVNGFWIDELYCYKVENGKRTGDNLVVNSGFELNDGENNMKENKDITGDKYTDYFNNLIDKKYIPIKKMEGKKIDGNYSGWEEIPAIVPYEKDVYLGTVDDVDVEAWYKCGYDEKYLYFILESTDDIYNSSGGSNYWSGDSVQIGISGGNVSFAEIGLSYDESTQKPYFTGIKNAQLEIKTEGRKRVYEAAFAWEDIFGEKPESFRLGLIVNDNDGEGRIGVLQTNGGGIARSPKTSEKFPIMIFEKDNGATFAWIDGDELIREGDVGSYTINIMNSGEEKEINVKIEKLNFEKTIKIDKESVYTEKIDFTFNKYDKYELVIQCEEIADKYGLMVNVVPTKDTFKTQFDKLENYISTLEQLMEECKRKNIPTDYELINLTLLKRNVLLIEDDIENYDTGRFDYLFRVLDNIYNEAKNNLTAYLNLSKTAVPATKPLVGNMEIIGNKIWADTDTDGKIERRPVFLIGYGHFDDTRNDLELLSDMGASYIQNEFGPNKTLKKSGKIPEFFGDYNYEAGGMNISKEESYTGEKSLHFLWTQEKKSSVYDTIFQSVVVEPGEVYEFGAMIKGNMINGVTMMPADWTPRHVLPNSAKEWTEVKYEYIPTSEITKLRIVLEDKTDMYMDDLFFRKKGTEENLIKNNSFEFDVENIPDYSGDITGLNAMANALRRAEEKNISYDILLSPHYLMSNIYTEYPGTAASTPGTIHFRVDHDVVKELIEEHIRTILDVATRYKSLSDICLTNEPCYSPVSNEYYVPMWIEYLKKEYNDNIEELNRIYNSNYSCFDEVDMPKKAETTPRNQDYRNFNDKIFSGFHKWMAEIVKEVAPNVPVHVKLMAGSLASTVNNKYVNHVNYGYNFEDFHKFTDFIGYDGGDRVHGGSFLGLEFTGGNHHAWYSVMDMQSSLKEAPSINSEDHWLTDGADEFIDANAQHIGRHIWQEGICGLGASAIWTYANSYTNKTLMNSIMKRPDCMLEVGRSAYDLNRLSYQVHAVNDAVRKVGILYSYINQNYAYEYKDAMITTYSAICYNGQKPLYVSEENPEKMQGLDVLFIPYVKNTNIQTINEINKFIDNGGRVVIFGENTLGFDEKNQPFDEEKVKRIFERSEVLHVETEYQEGNTRESGTYVMTEPSYKDILELAREIFKEENLDIVTIVDAETGERVVDGIDYRHGYYNGKMILNVCNFGDYDKPRKISIYIKGEKVENLKELRFNKIHNGVVSVDAGKPLLFEIDVDSLFVDTYRHWAEKDIAFLEKNGLVAGVKPNEFYPEKSLTRAEWIVMLMRIANVECDADTDISDISGHWAENEISIAYKNGIIEQLVNDGKFYPDKNITRSEMSQIVYMFMTVIMKKTFDEIDGIAFDDEDETKYSEAVRVLHSSGLLSGYPDNTFRGESGLTRAEGAVILKKILEF